MGWLRSRLDPRWQFGHLEPEGVIGVFGVSMQKSGLPAPKTSKTPHEIPHIRPFALTYEPVFKTSSLSRKRRIEYHPSGAGGVVSLNFTLFQFFHKLWI